ncbi:MAG: MMPL family transporter [Planctomycetota bacterium]
MTWLWRFSVRRPGTVTAIAGLLTLAAVPGLLRLRLRTDGHALVPQSAPEVALDHATRAEFGIDDPIVLHITTDHSDGVFNMETLRLVDSLTQTLKTLDGVREADVMSLATEPTDRVFPGTLRFRRLLEPFPTTPADLQRVREDLHLLQLYDGVLVSLDDRSTAILVGIPASADRLAFIRHVESIAAENDIPSHRINVIGAPLAEGLLGTHILEDLGIPPSLLGFQTWRHANEPSAPLHSFNDLRSWIGSRIGLVPIALLLIASVFFICFRAPAAVALPLIEVGACLTVVFGVMGWMDVPVYLTTAILPIILTATGITDEIHVFARYRHHLRTRPEVPQQKLLEETLGEMTRPVVMTTVTTAIGFLSFAFSDIAAVRWFGIFTAMGIGCCMLWSMSVIPAWLSRIPARHFTVPVATRPVAPRLWRAFGWLGGKISRHPTSTIGLVLLLLITTPLGIRQVMVQDSWIDGFAKGSAFRQAIDEFNGAFHGMHVLLLRVDAGDDAMAGEISADATTALTVTLPPHASREPSELLGWRLTLTRLSDPSHAADEDIARRRVPSWNWWVESAERTDQGVVVHLPQRQPWPSQILTLRPGNRLRFELYPARMMKADTLRRVRGLEQFVRGRTEDAVGGVLGTTDYVATVNFMIRGRKAEERSIPDDVPRLERIWSEYGRIRGEDRLRQLVDGHYARSIITVLLKDANFIDTARLMDAIRVYEKEHLAPHGTSISFAGDVAVSQTLIEAIVRTQVVSLAGALAGDFLVTAIIGRSVVFGLLCILPSLVAVLANFAVMGWLGIPLGVATSMFSAMTLGIGVDYAIHLQSRFQEIHRAGASRSDAVAEAVATTGSAIAVDTLAVALGFGIMVFSQVPANAWLGGMVAQSLLLCFGATVLLLPALLSIAKRLDRRAVSLPT